MSRKPFTSATTSCGESWHSLSHCCTLPSRCRCSLQRSSPTCLLCWQEFKHCCLQQADSKLHCASAGNLIGAAGAQALLQAVHTSTGRLTALDLSGELATLGAADSCAVIAGHSAGISANRLGPWLLALSCAAAGRLAIQYAGLPGSRCLHRSCLWGTMLSAA